MIKLFVGLLKGAVIGGGIGYAAYAGHLDGITWLWCGVVGALVGLLVGRPIWSLIKDQNATTFVSLLKMAFGFGVGVGLWALVAKLWQPSPTLLVIQGQDVLYWAPTLCGAVGALYGAFVELDDGVGADKAADAAAAKKPTAIAKKK